MHLSRSLFLWVCVHIHAYVCVYVFASANTIQTNQILVCYANYTDKNSLVEPASEFGWMSNAH